MNWHAAVAILAAVIQIVAIIPYIRDTLQGHTRPNVVSWSLWMVAVLTATAAQIAAGPSWSLTLLISADIITVTVVTLCLLGYGYKEFRRLDRISIALSLSALFLWYITKEPLSALILAIAADASAYAPTFAKAYREPHTETATLWLGLSVVGVLSAVASTQINVANLAFPLYYALINVALWTLIFFGQRRTQTQQPTV